MPRQNNYSIKAVEDACSLLRELCLSGPVPFGAIVTSTGFTNNKTFRLLETLKEQGFIEKNNDQYCLGCSMVTYYARYIADLKKARDNINTKLVGFGEA